MRTLALAGLLLLGLAAPAAAATPESGTVSAATPSVKWEGTAPGYGVFPTDLLLTGLGEDPAPCEAPYCDTFTLTVADKADLNVTALCRSADNFTELRVTKPDGELLFAQSAQGQAVRIKVKQAVPGEYVVNVMTNDSVIASGEYDAEAVLAIAPPVAAAPAVAPPAAAPAPAPAPERAAATLAVRTRSVSARARSFKLALTSTAPVTAVKVRLRKGRRTLSTGRLKALDGRGTVRLKPRRRLRPGTYLLAITARDGARTVGLTTRLKVRR